MTSKEYLSQIYNLDHKIYLMRLEAEEYRRLSYSLPGQDFTKPFVKSSNPNTEAPFMKWLIKALDKEKEIEDLLKKMEELTNDITNTIDEVENLDYRVLLKLRYINLHSLIFLVGINYVSRFFKPSESICGLMKIDICVMSVSLWHITRVMMP